LPLRGGKGCRKKGSERQTRIYSKKEEAVLSERQVSGGRGRYEDGRLVGVGGWGLGGGAGTQLRG